MTSYDDYRELAARLPADTTEAARTHVVTALGRVEEDSLADVLERIGTSPNLMCSVALDLGDAPARHLGAAHTALVAAVGAHPEALAGPAANALAELLARTPQELLPTRLGEALTAVCGASRHLDRLVWQNHPQRLLTALPGIADQGPEPGTARGEVPDEVLTVLREHYPRLGNLARRTAVLAHLRGPLPADRTAEFARSPAHPRSVTATPSTPCGCSGSPR